MKTDFAEFVIDWERRALEELSQTYRWILRERKIGLTPALIEICDAETFWGQWNAETRCIRVSRKLLREHPWDQVLGVLKHEMAHQMVDEVLHSNRVDEERPHGDSFQAACRALGVPAHFARASSRLRSHQQAADLDWRLDTAQDDESERMLEKIRKLLALASSSNEHEAVLAMNRAREIFAKYNLEHAERSEFVHLVISTGSKRMEVHTKKILSILLNHFYVEVISGHTFDVRSGESHRMFELIGRRENVLMAEYVYHFLLKQSELLAGQLMRTHARTTKVSRKSFRLGILQGFKEKLKAAETPEEGQPSVLANALIAFSGDRKLEDYIGTVYRRLRRTRGAMQSIDPEAFRQGKSEGRKLTLNKPVSSSGVNLGRLLAGR